MALAQGGSVSSSGLGITGIAYFRMPGDGRAGPPKLSSRFCRSRSPHDFLV